MVTIGWGTVQVIKTGGGGGEGGGGLWYTILPSRQADRPRFI